MNDNEYKIITPILKRRSTRVFEPRPVEREKILSCIEAARVAPSAENIQPWRFLIFDDQDKKNEFLKEVTKGIYRHTKWAFSAPVIIVLIAETSIIAHKIGGTIQKIPFHVLDIGISGEHLVLQATELGLGSCWIGWFNRKKSEKILKLSRNFHVYSLLALGYPKEDKRYAPRKLLPMEKIVTFNSPNQILTNRR